MNRLHAAVLAAAFVSCIPKETDSMLVELPPMPPAAPTPQWSPPAPTKLALASGLPVWLHEDHDLPLVSLRIQIPTGSVDDPQGRWGTAALTASMMQEAAGELTSLERAAALDRLAARFSVDPGREWTTVVLDVHKDRLAAAMPLLADAILRPKLLSDDWERVKQRHVTSIEQGLDDNPVVAAMIAPALLFGPDHPYGHPVNGTLPTASTVTLEEVQGFWRRNLHAGGAQVVVVGDVEPQAVIGLLDTHLAEWTASERTAREFTAPDPRPGRHFVHRADSSQTVIRTLALGPSGSAERAPADLARVVLGGSFTSRLNQRLREDKGYTYGARLGLSEWSHAGMTTSSSNVRADATAAALVDVFDVLGKARDEGFTEVELQRARAQALSDLVDAGESRAALAGTYAHEIEVGRDPARIDQRGAELSAVDAAAMQAAARQWMDPDRMGVLLVGDRTVVMPQLEAAGLTGWVFLDEHGNLAE